MNIAQKFGSNIRTAREAAGLSQEELGKIASLHRTEIGLLERGGRLPRVDTAAKVAHAARVSPGDLYDGIQWVPGKPREGHFAIDGVDE